MDVAFQLQYHTQPSHWKKREAVVATPGSVVIVTSLAQLTRSHYAVPELPLEDQPLEGMLVVRELMFTRDRASAAELAEPLT